MVFSSMTFSSMFDSFTVDGELFGNPLMKWQLFGLRFLGYIYSPTDRMKVFHFLRGNVATISMLILICAQVVDVWQFRDNLDHLSIALGANITCINVLARSVGFYWYHKIYIKLFHDVQVGVKKMLITSLPKELKIYASYIKYITIMDYAAAIPFAMTIFVLYGEGSYFLIFEWNNKMQNIQNPNSTVTLARLFNLYPIHHFTKNFFLAYITPFYLSVVGIFSMVCWHTLNAALMRFAAFRLDILNYKIENISVYANIIAKMSNRREKTSENQLLRSVLMSCLKDFKEIKSFVSEYEFASNVVMFIESSTIVVILCVQLYIISKDFSAGYDIYGFWCLATVGILWLYYWHANEISYKSNQITNAVYALSWYELPATLQKEVATFMIITMKPIVMKTGFVHMNIEAFLKILKSSYSYFTILQNFAE